jgi:hypothetical protein
MTETRNGYFDSESLSRMGTALDEAWKTLPPSQQTPEIKIALAKAILHLEAEGELDPARLSSRALGLIATGDRHDFEVLSGDGTIAAVQSIIVDANVLWPRIVELAKAHALGCRIRVTDQSGAMVALVGVATALRFASAATGGSS